ncbi:MAG: hypothetical protein P8J17_02185, partial [Halioglobus sp.]|nr:hypothetical protein [Halioglobus sp.]
LRRAAGKAMYPELTADLTGGIARFKPIRLDLLARDAICAAEARAANASTLDETTERAAIDTDIRQIEVLLNQATGAIVEAVGDGDLSIENAATLNERIEQSMARLTLNDLKGAATKLGTACS